MSTPKISFSDLEDAFQNSSYEHHYWLDKQTGRVILIDDEIADVLREGEDLSDLPDWQREMAEEMMALLRALGELPGDEAGDEAELGRFVKVPKQESHDAYEVMEDFAETVANPHLRDLLEVALRGKGAFRRFKDVLLSYPAERERWFAFEDMRRREAVETWAREEGLEIDFEKGR
ncbi:MAG: UPF0158 family protein [Acidobacteriota bacterium]